MARKLSDLRDTLFDQLEKLKSADESKTEIEIERSKAMAQVSSQIINSAKLEMQFLETIGHDRLPEVVDPSSASKFYSEPRKGLGTGKQLGAPKPNGASKGIV